MAILVDYTTQSGIPLTQVYLSINKIIWEYSNSLEIKFNFDIKLNSNSTISIEDNSYSFMYDLTSSDNVLIQCYNYLKSLNKFSNVMEYVEPEIVLNDFLIE
jgi:uncharacterized protein YjaG (DUF416 family)